MRQVPHARRRVAGSVHIRIVVAVVLAAAVCALLLPAAASAKVDKKHAARYKNGVNGLSHILKTDQETFNAYASALADTAQSIEAILSSDPVDHDALLNEEAAAARLVTDEASFVHTATNLEAAADYFFFHAKGWFRSAADGIKFRQGTHKISAAAVSLQTAWKNMALAAGQLAIDPPDLAKAREYNQVASNAVDIANQKIKDGFAILRALQR